MAMNISSNATLNIKQLNGDIKGFPQVHPITEEMSLTFEGVSRLVMLDRYSFKDTSKMTLSTGDLVVLTIKEDPKYPARGTGFITELNHQKNQVTVLVEEEYRSNLEDAHERETGEIVRSIDTIEKPLEIYYEQIAKRNASGLSEVEAGSQQAAAFEDFYAELKSLNFVPAGRVLYGAGS